MAPPAKGCKALASLADVGRSACPAVHLPAGAYHLMTEERQHLARGLLWVGSATAVSRITDALSLILVLRFLSREEIGIATLAWSVTVFVECFNGLGIGTAVLQQQGLTKVQISSAFWYALGIALVLVLGVSLAAPWIALAYGTPELLPMIRVSSLKLLFVGLAAVPLALLGRDMRYKSLGAVTTAATLVSSLITLGLAATGYGAWAPLLGNTVSGLMQWLGASVLCPAYSRRFLDLRALRPMMRAGGHIAGSVAVVQLSRNLDYLLLGRLVGVEVLGGYRVAFDLAMAPSIAISQIGNRTALPVYARLAQEPQRLAQAWLWTVRTVMLMTLPVIVFVLIDGLDVLTLLGKSGWPHAGTAIRLLCGAAVFRGLAETFPSVYVAAGRSQLALVHSLINLCLVAACMFFGLRFFPSHDQVLVIASAWVLATALLMVSSLVLSRGVIDMRVSSFAQSLRGPLILFVWSAVAMLLAQPLLPAEPSLRLLADVLILIVAYLTGLRVLLGVRFSSLWKPKAPVDAGEEDLPR